MHWGTGTHPEGEAEAGSMVGRWRGGEWVLLSGEGAWAGRAGPGRVEAVGVGGGRSYSGEGCGFKRQ